MKLHPLGLRIGGCPFVSHVYIKQHETKEPGEQQVQTALFVAGLPLCFDDDALRAAFSCFGDVTQTVQHPSKRSGIVVFTSKAAVQAALQAAQQAQLIELPETRKRDDESPAGVKAWVAAHKQARPGLSELQRQLDDWTERYEAEEAARIRAAQEAMAGDGWTVVTRTKGRKRTREDDGIVAQSGGIAKAAAAAMAAAKQTKPLEDFYRFQQRDKRRSELMDLRKKFDEDRKRISSLRAARNFKPV